MNRNVQQLLIGLSLGFLSGYIIYKLTKKQTMLPLIISGSFTGKNCDELHAFESTHGKVIGGMNTKIKAALLSLYNQGINPEVTQVEVIQDTKLMKVSWSVTINESTDGKAWVGFTSRGASGSDAFTRAVSKAVKQDAASLLNNVVTSFDEPNAELKEVFDFRNNLDSTGKAIGKCPTRQVFYNYTRPRSNPKHA